MELIIGGRSQGKLQYALGKNGLTKDDVAFGEFSHQPILYGLQELILKLMEEGKDPMTEIGAYLSAHPETIVICDEMGSGLVPMEAFQRDYRDMVGKVCCELAKTADAVTRVYCGIGTVIKG